MLDLRELWRYRELFVFLAWRDILVRYKQMVMGIGWAVIRPLLTMLVFTVIFGRLANLPSEGVPYPLLVMAAMHLLAYSHDVIVDWLMRKSQNTSLVVIDK